LIAPPISDDELALLNELMAAELGIVFPDHKREILESRLRPRLEELRLRSFLDYYVLLQYDSGNGRQEISRLASLVTNNESYFFRETYQFDSLFGSAIDELKEAAAESRRIRILSAGCSSGEEAYTLNIFARENQYRMFGHDVTIDAFDVDSTRIAMASRAEYSRGSLRGAAEEQIAKYFTAAGENVRVKPLYRSGVSFRVGNLLRDETYGAPGAYDVVFCRNVLIYFAEEMIRCALERFHRALRPGGLLFLGHAESAIGISAAFEPERVGNCIAYRRGE
jgi:chemotaxis protein methyltransferase CheR